MFPSQVGARYSSPLKYSVAWPGSSVSAPVSIDARGTMTLTALLDREADALLTLVVTAEPEDTPELAVSTLVDIEVRGVGEVLGGRVAGLIKCVPW